MKIDLSKIPIRMIQAVSLVMTCVSCMTYVPVPGSNGPLSLGAPQDSSAAQQQQQAQSSLQPASSSLRFTSRTTGSQLAASMDRIAPTSPRPSDHEIFARYSPTNGRGTWANNWMRGLDFSGVAWNTPYAGTLITPQHVVFARHYPIPNGTILRFTDRHGNPVARRLVRQDFAWFDSFKVRTDISVGLLDAPVPDTVKVYRVFPGNQDPNALRGAKVLTTTRHRRVYMSQISHFDLFNGDSEVVSTAHVKGPGWRYPIVKGDSGNPMFVLHRGELVLLSTHTFFGVPGKGPHYGGPGNQRKVRRLINSLSSSRYD